MARRTLLLIASILMAALGTALIWLYVQGAENRAQQNAELVPALFLTRNVAVGESPANAVTTKEVPPSVAATAVTSEQGLAAATLHVPGLEGQVLLRSMLVSSGSEPGRFPKNGAASLTISDPNRVPTDLRVGDTVDVIEFKKDAATHVDGLTDLTVRTIGTATAAATGTAAPGANGAVQNSAIPATIVGFDIKDQKTAELLYSITARGDQAALYLHNATP